MYLDGAVTLQRLGPRDGDGPFRAADARGEVAWAAVGTPFEYLHVIEFAAAGVRRGFHRHAGHVERLYLFRGALRALVRAAEGGAVLGLELRAGDLLTLGDGVAHGFVATEPSLAVALGTGADPLRHTVATPELAAP